MSNKKQMVKKQNNNNKHVIKKQDNKKQVNKKQVNKKQDNRKQDNKKQVNNKVKVQEKQVENVSEDEMQKMLGNSDNSDIESEEFSEEECTKSVEAKVNKKRKLEDDDECETLKKKKSKVDEIDLCEESDNDDEEEDEEDDDDDEMEDDSFIDDEECEEDGSEEECKEEEKAVEKDIKITEEKPKLALSDTLKEEVNNRILDRKNRSFVLFNLPFNYGFSQVKELVPDLVSSVIPYNLYRHQINGNAYIDMKQKEDVDKCIKELNGKIVGGRTIKALPLNLDQCIENYDCTKLVLSNLSFKITNENLTKVLTKATSIKLIPVQKVDRKMTRVAFAEYNSVDDAIYDLDNNHGAVIDGLPINLQFQDVTNKKRKRDFKNKQTQPNDQVKENVVNGKKRTKKVNGKKK